MLEMDVEEIFRPFTPRPWDVVEFALSKGELRFGELIPRRNNNRRRNSVPVYRKCKCGKAIETPAHKSGPKAKWCSRKCHRKHFLKEKRSKAAK